MVRVRMKRRIAPGHQHRKTPRKSSAVPQTLDYRGKIGPGMGRNRGIPICQQGNLAAAPHYRNKEPVSVGRAGRQ